MHPGAHFIERWSYLHYSRPVRILLRLAFLLLLCMSGSLEGIFTPPSASAAPLRSVQSHSILLQAGSTATLDVRGLALQPGSSITSEGLTLATTPLAPDRIRTTLFYAIDWGYTESAPDQVALAVWYAQDGVWRTPDHAIAERIATAAASSQGSPSWRPEGRSMLPLVGEQLLVQELSLTPLASSPAVGRGKLTVRNTGNQDLLVYLPYGALFTGPSDNVLVWATAPDQTEVEPPGQATPSETALLTDPPRAEETATPSYKNGSTPVAESTPSYKAVRPSPTAVEGSNLPPAATEIAATPEQAQDEPSPTSPAIATSETGGNVRSKPQPLADKPVEGVTKENATGNIPAAPAQTPVMDGVTSPLSIASGPPPELPKAQPTARNDAPIPSPVGTEPADELPPPVATGDAGTPRATLPPAQETGAVPIKTTLANPTFTPKPTSTPVPTKDETSAGASVDARSSSDNSGDAKPTPQPAPVAPSGTDNSPSVTVKSSDGPTPSQLPVASPPSSAPATGGGPSGASTWLAICAALLLAIGLQMRRASAPKSVQVPIEQSE